MEEQLAAVENLYFAAIQAGDYDNAARLYLDILPRMRRLADNKKRDEFSRKIKPIIEYLDRLLDV